MEKTVDYGEKTSDKFRIEEDKDKPRLWVYSHCGYTVDRLFFEERSMKELYYFLKKYYRKRAKYEKKQREKVKKNE